VNAMYNRYIPQSDGSYRRNQVPEQKKTPPQEPKCPVPPAPSRKPEPHREAAAPYDPMRFLKNLLPKDFDTSDLLIVLLLLLISGDSRENQNTSILTLALYLFL